MADKPNPQARPTPLGIYDKPKHGGISGIEVVAIAVSAIWLIGAAIFFIAGPEVGAEADGTRFLITML
ncbi:MAG: hypothetical protein AAFP16_06780, partial [Pseudomonadota bacterium]